MLQQWRGVVHKKNKLFTAGVPGCMFNPGREKEVVSRDDFPPFSIHICFTVSGHYKDGIYLGIMGMDRYGNAGPDN